MKIDKIPIRRTVEQHEHERQSQQLRQSQQESLNIQNLGPYTNQTPPPYSGKPSPPYVNRPSPAYSTLFPVRFQPQGGISLPPYQSRYPSPSRPPTEQDRALSLVAETILTHKHACEICMSYWNNLVTNLIVPSSLLRVVNSLFQTCSDNLGQTMQAQLVNRL